MDSSLGHHERVGILFRQAHGGLTTNRVALVGRSEEAGQRRGPHARKGSLGRQLLLGHVVGGVLDALDEGLEAGEQLRWRDRC